MRLKTIAPIALILAVAILANPVHARFSFLGSNDFPSAEGLEVNDVLADPSGYTGQITVRGGVTIASKKKKLVDLVDYREYRTCRKVDCGFKWLTVIVDKEIPKKKDVVEVTGVIEKNDAGKGGYVLRATKLVIKGAPKR